MTETRNRSSPRLRFSKEELANPELARKAEKAEKAADRYDAAKKKLQKRRLKLTAEEVQTEQSAIQQSEADAAELHEPASPSSEPSSQKKQAAKEGHSPKPSGKATAPTFPVTQTAAEADIVSAPHARKKKLRLRFEETKAKPPSHLRHPVQRPIESAHDQLHQQLAEANEDDNAAASLYGKADEIEITTTVNGKVIRKQNISMSGRQTRFTVNLQTEAFDFRAIRWSPECPNLVYKLLKEGKISSIKVGRTYRIPKVHLLSYMRIVESKQAV